MSYDQKCYDLAEHFYPDAPRAWLEALAQEIQTLIEGAADRESV